LNVSAYSMLLRTPCSCPDLTEIDSGCPQLL
jgi:hypothetical protein